jgi:hypothetical protein
MRCAFKIPLCPPTPEVSIPMSDIGKYALPAAWAAAGAMYPGMDNLGLGSVSVRSSRSKFNKLGPTEPDRLTYTFRPDRDRLMESRAWTDRTGPMFLLGWTETDRSCFGRTDAHKCA